MTKTQTIILLSISAVLIIGILLSKDFAQFVAGVKTVLIASFIGVVIIPMVNNDKEE